MSTLVYNIAVNDADYKVSKRKRLSNGVCKKVWGCPFYSKWMNMLTRCYSEAFHRNRPSYRDCTVCKDWLVFSNFKDWMSRQNWDGKVLDKDLVGNGNKIYSPDTCVFVSPELNSFLLINHKIRGDLPAGVSLSKDGCYRSRITINAKERSLGEYSCPYEAHKHWQLAKISVAEDYLSKETDARVTYLLEDLIQRIRRDIESGKVTEFSMDAKYYAE